MKYETGRIIGHRCSKCGKEFLYDDYGLGDGLRALKDAKIHVQNDHYKGAKVLIKRVNNDS